MGNKQQLRSASKPLSYSKKNFGKLMQKQARAAIEDKEFEADLKLPEREFKKKKLLDKGSALEEEMKKEMLEKEAKGKIQKDLEVDVATSFLSAEEAEKRKLEAEENKKKEEAEKEKDDDSWGDKEEMKDDKKKDDETDINDELKVFK